MLIADAGVLQMCSDHFAVCLELKIHTYLPSTTSIIWSVLEIWNLKKNLYSRNNKIYASFYAPKTLVSYVTKKIISCKRTDYLWSPSNVLYWNTSYTPNPTNSRLTDTLPRTSLLDVQLECSLGSFTKHVFFMKKMVQPPLHVIEQGFIEKMLQDY